MTRLEIKNTFRVDNPEITSRVITDAQLDSWLLVGDKEICAETRCVKDQDGMTIETAEDDQYYDLPDNISKFYDIDEFPGGGVTYNDKRIKEKTIAQLDAESPNWRSNSSGSPKAYYRRGKWLYLDRPINSNAYDIKVYSILISDDFNDDGIMPFNQHSWLEPFHYALVLYLQKKAKMKVGKGNEEMKALNEFNAYIKWMKKVLGGGRYTKIQFTKSASYS